MKKKIIKFIPFILIFIIVLTVIIALNINKTYTAGITKDEVKAMPENTLLAEIMGDNGPVRFDVKDANAELTLFDDFSKQETYNVEIALKYSNEDLVKTAKVMLKEGILFADTETLELENLESVTTDEKNPNTGTNIYKFNNATETIIFNILIKPNIIGKIEDAITIELYNDDTLKDSKNIDLNIKAENEDTTQDSLPNNNINNYETPSVDEPAAIDETGPFTYDLGISSLSYEDPLHPAPITE